MYQEKLTIDFEGSLFKSPFILASFPPSMEQNRIICAAKLGGDGAVIKTIIKNLTINPRTRLGAIRNNEKAVEFIHVG
ncbi:hypothetical protein EU527_05455 [Candidatus Thorarchaeota archaeon]|nr:MAG: hypothetical protein EU527_05455 [Candidatus Thorarchaeota archaeon]